ncbi:hypothetical protein V6Z12_A03G064400 [Gossypium hirsutum]
MEHVFFHCTRAIQVWQIFGVSVSQATITGFFEHYLMLGQGVEGGQCVV